MGKELAEQYENEMFDFEQLSASLVSNVMLLVSFTFKLQTATLLGDYTDLMHMHV